MTRNCCTRLTAKNPAVRRWAIPFLLLFLLVPSAFFWIQSGTFYLVVSTPRDGKVLYRLPVKEGQEFSLEYTHSVTGRPVQGTFSLTGDRKIKPLTTIFDAYGPGLPYLDGATEYSVDEQGFITVFHQEEPRDSIRLFVSPLTGEALRLDGRVYDLGNLRPDPFLLEIKLKKY